MATGFTYLRQSEDLVPNSTLTPVSENPDFPWDNVKTADIGVLGKGPEFNDAVDLLIDTGGSYPWNLVVIGNSNFTPSAVIRIKSGTTSGTTDNNDLVPWREFDQYLKVSTRTHRYIRIDAFDDGHAEPQVSIGRVMVGPATTFAFRFMFNWTVEDVEDDTVLTSDLDTDFVNRVAEYVVIVLQFRELSRAYAVLLRAFIKSLQGRSLWFFFIPDLTEYEGYFMTRVTNFKQIRDFNTHTAELVLREESRGLKLGA